MSSNLSAPKPPNFYPKTWFVCAVIILAASAILWIWLQLASRVTKERSFAETEAASKTMTPDQFPANLGTLSDIVPVLDLTKITSNRPEAAHAAEFKALAFITEHQSDWTLQVMNVSQESVITDFLAKRSDRSRFQYFRYNKGAKDESFILTYGAFPAIQTALGAAQTMDFGLPSSVKAFPERFSSYRPFVSDSDENMVESSANSPRQVKLRPVAIPPPTDAIEDKLAEIAAESSAAMTTSPSPTSKTVLPANVDGFSGLPDAPAADPVAPAPSNSKSKGAASSTGPVQDPFN
ncbi:hypothetical protein [Aquirhabdus sp.]|uniref:hypothetical protein n=1 Tax=Aquirhabdus sp. TaxID=2824160 RepID=UPI00396CC743